MKLIIASFLFSLITACSCSTTSESQDILKTSKANPNQRVCRLVREPVEIKGVYCVIYEGPANIHDGKG